MGRSMIVILDCSDDIPRIQQGNVIKAAGGAAMILVAVQSDGYTTIVDAHVIPTSLVSYPAATKINSLINFTTFPTATIIPQGSIIGAGDLPSPMTVCFSSRGPSIHNKGIIKKDIIGPGVNVLDRWPSLPIGPIDSPALFNVKIGTSMSAPHLSGIAALLKKANLMWSPAAIKSAIMMTGYNENLAGKPIEEEKLRNANLFASGAGHVNPNKANNPSFI